MKVFAKKAAAFCLSALIVITGGGIGLTAGATDPDDLKPTAQWLNAYRTDYGASAVIQTADGGYLTAGTTDSGSLNGKAVLVKFNSAGVKGQEIQYPASGNGYFNDVKQLADGGYIAAGGLKISGSNVVPVIVKFNSSGTVVWERTVSGVDFASYNAVITTSDGGFVAAGSYCPNSTVMNEAILRKYSSGGDVVWTYTVGEDNLQNFASVVQTSDGGYIAAGNFDNAAGTTTNGVIYKFNSLGVNQWQRSFSNDSGFEDIRQTADGGYIAAGSIMASSSNRVPLIVRYNASGTKLWDRTVTQDDYAQFSTVIPTTDGNFVAAGSSFSSANVNDALIKVYDANGGVLWSLTIGGTDLENFSDMKPTADGGLILVGTSSSSDGDFAGKITAGSAAAFIVKLNSIYDKDGDGVPNNRDQYPLDATRSYDTSELNPAAAPSVQITGTQTGSGYAGTVNSQTIASLAAGSNVGFDLDNVSVNIPVELLDSQLDGSVTDSITLTQSASPQDTISQASTLITAGDTIVGAFDFSLQKISADGQTVEDIHQLGGNAKVTIRLTDAQAALLTDISTARVYYFNTTTNALEPVDAVFDLQAKTVTFYTDHFSTYLIKAAGASIPHSGSQPALPVAALFMTAAVLALGCAVSCFPKASRRMK
jgi:hypothetical protein